nr:hypothetical protein [Tanacetum cinerariifolium]
MKDVPLGRDAGELMVDPEFDEEEMDDDDDDVEWLMALVTPSEGYCDYFEHLRGNLEYRHGVLMRKMVEVSDAEVGDSIAIGEIHPRVATMEEQVQTLQTVLHGAELQNQQLRTKVAEMESREGTMMSYMLWMEEHLTVLEKRLSGPPSRPYVVPTGRIVVPTSRYIFPIGRVVVPTGRYIVPAVRAACYVLNRVLVTSPHNQTPYALLTGNIPYASHFKPFGCHVTVLNTSDHLGKFDGKDDEGYIVGYSISYKHVQANQSAGTQEATTNPAGLQDADSDSDCDEQAIIVPSYPSCNIHGTKPKDTFGDAVDASPLNFADEIFQKELARLKGQEQRATSDAESLGLGSANDVKEHQKRASAKIVPPGSIPVPTGSIPVPSGDTMVSTDDVPVHTSSPTDSFFNDEPTTRFLSPSNLGNHDPSPGIFFSSSYDDAFGAALNNVTSSVEVLVDLPAGKYDIGTKWILKNKRDATGIVVQSKARLVTQGHRQEDRIDYDEVFAPVERIEAIRLFLAFASYMGFMVYQMDVKSVFLYRRINEEVYVTQPKGFVDPQHPKKVYKVIKALYGLHQAPRAWYATLSTFLLKHGYKRGTIDNTLFLKKNKRYTILGEFRMSAMGELTFFLDLQVQQRLDGMFISQDKSMIGSLMYLTASRPDIMFAISACSRNQVTPTTSNFEAVKKIFKYLKGQPKFGLWYPRESSFVLEAYSDSDYAGANKDRKSTTGGCQFLGRRLISWQCKKQTIMATSSTEAEYVAAANCCAQTLNPNSTSSMAALRYMDEHNKVGYLLKPTRSDDYLQIIDFLRASHIRYALTHDPIIFDSLVKQFWSTAMLRSLELADDGGIDDLPIAKIYSGMDNLGTKSGSWDQFGSPLAVALIYLSDGRQFNWSSYIFKGMKKHKPKRKHTKEPKVPPTKSQAEHNVPLPLPSHDPLPSGEDRLKLKELMELCTNLSNKVLDLESEVIDIKSTYKAKIEKLKSRVERLEEENRILKELKGVHSTFDSDEPVMEKEESFKHDKKIAGIDADVEINLEKVQAEGMSYDEIRPLFEKHYKYNQAFLNEVNEGIKFPKKEVRQEKEVKVESSKRKGPGSRVLVGQSGGGSWGEWGVMRMDVVRKLVKKVKAMEVRLKTTKKKMVVSDSDQEERGKQDVDLDALLALDNAVVTVDSNISPGGASNNLTVSTSVLADVPTGASNVPTDSTSVPADVPTGVTPLGVSNKGKAPMVEKDITVKERSFKQMQEDILGEQAAKRLHDEEQAQADRQRAELQRRRQQEVLASAMTLKRTCLIIEEPFSKRQKSTEAPIPSMPKASRSPVVSSPKSSGTRRKSLGRNRLTKPKSKLQELDLDADAQTFIKVVSNEDSEDEAPRPWSALVGWKVITTPLGAINALYRIGRSTKHFTTLRQILHMVDRHDIGDLQVLFDSHEGGKGSFIWKNQHLWQIRSWRLYTLSNVHVLDTVSGEVVFMFTDVSYPLSVKLMERMLTHKLEIEKDVVGNDMTTAEQLIRVFNSPMLHLLRVEMVINSPWIMPILGTKELASPEQTAPGLASPRVSSYLVKAYHVAVVVLKYVAGSRFPEDSSMLLTFGVQVQASRCCFL